MYKIQLSPLAKDDLLNLKKYLAYEFDENIANEMMKKVTVSFRNLEEFPLLGRPLTNLINIPTEYMYYLADKNYVFYRIEGRSIKVIRILSTRQDFIQLLFNL
jgi:plasmid stabilization system protein ParE